jgi:2-polyprenyl-3-methyl-5-hydroxy-6-metoxy-1,4-benzoquinol methylase
MSVYPLSLERFDTHAGTVHSTDPLRVESIPAQWSYTISVQVPLSAIDVPLPLLISADVTVEHGSVGACLVGGDLTTMLARIPLPVTAGRHRLELILEQAAESARLVFRNHTAGGHPCVFTVESISVSPAPPEGLALPSRLHEVTEGSARRIDIAKLARAIDGGGSWGYDDQAVFALLRTKWSTVPGGLSDRRSSRDLAALSDDELVSLWRTVHSEATTGAGFQVRGWYHELYRDVLRGKKVLEIGSGMGIDGIAFARAGARMTFVDIVQSNLDVLARLCRIFGVSAEFVYLHDLSSLDSLPDDFDIVWCQGSLINVPFDFVARECAAILRHLKPSGRWIELAYPRERWERDGSPSFSLWGTMTDGEGTPWMEWYDLERVLRRLQPAIFAPVLALNFHNDDFNWFDLVRVS